AGGGSFAADRGGAAQEARGDADRRGHQVLSGRGLSPGLLQEEPAALPHLSPRLRAGRALEAAMGQGAGERALTRLLWCPVPEVPWLFPARDRGPEQGATTKSYPGDTSRRSNAARGHENRRNSQGTSGTGHWVADAAARAPAMRSRIPL